MRTKRIEVHESGGNIFADLGLPDADNHFLKAQIVAELYRLTNARKLTQDKAGALMEISQPEVSRLFKGNFREYSIERLIAFLTAFDRDVEIVSRPRSKRTKKSERGQIIFKPVAASNRHCTFFLFAFGLVHPRLVPAFGVCTPSGQAFLRCPVVLRAQNGTEAYLADI